MIKTAMEAAKTKTLMNKVLREIGEWVAVFAAAFILVLLLNTAVFATTQVRQTSMMDTLMEGQHLLVEKLGYMFSKPSRGDIIVFIEGKYTVSYLDKIKIFVTDISEILEPAERKTNIRLVKRVIGIPGDEIDIREGNVYVNGTPLEENYIKGKTLQREMHFPITVEKDKYFVLGDNREVSKDSRTFGLIDSRQIEGRVVYRFWPLRVMGIVK